jgi:ketosteroid isomerase-like protein
MGDGGLEDRVAALEGRVRQLEDALAIMRLINSWGPAVDTGSSQAAANLWDADAVLDSDLSRLEGPAAVSAMVDSQGQRALIDQGCAHVQSAPVITVEGDRATAIAYSQVFLHAEQGHDVWRVSANRWECRRTPDGWRVTKRVNRVVDGTPDSRALLVGAFDRPR